MEFLLPSNNLSLILYLVQLFIAECMFFFNMEKRDRFALRFTLSAVAFFVLAYFIPVIIYHYIEGFLTMSAFLISLVCYLFCFKNKFRDLLFCMLGAVTIQNLTNNVRLIILFLADFEEGGTLDVVITIGVYVVLYVGAYFIVARRIRGIQDIAINRWLMIIILFLSVILIFTLQYWVSISEYERSVVVRLPFLLCNIFMLFMQFSYWDSTKVAQEKHTMEQLLQQQAKQYELSKETVDIINMKCHDLKNQINVLSKIGDGSANLKSIEESAGIYDNIVKTGNSALDVVICEKGLICEKAGIRFLCQADGELLNFMDPVDLAMLFGNALDNAIESARNIETEDERLISIKISAKASLICISVENTCAVTPKFENGLPQTTKADKQNHGYGVRSIKYIVDKYKGTTVMRADNNLFCLNIVIPDDHGQHDHGVPQAANDSVTESL